jgi:glycine cleavage system regulatory protein
MGLELLGRVVRHARDRGTLPAKPQDVRFATRAPMIRRAVLVNDDAPATATSLVVTVMGPDRPGIVRMLSDRAQRYGANWAASRLSRLAGEFAGMVHFEVPPENATALADSLRGLERSSGLKLVIAKSDSAPVPTGQRGVELELVGNDRVGIVSNLTRILADSGVSIEHINTELVGTTPSGPRTFKIVAHLLVPNTLSSDELRRRLETVASEMMVDIALGDSAG